MTVTDGWRFNLNIHITPADDNINMAGVYIAGMSEGRVITQQALNHNDAIKAVGQGVYPASPQSQRCHQSRRAGRLRMSLILNLMVRSPVLR